MQKFKSHKFGIQNTVKWFSIFLKQHHIPLTQQKRWGHRCLCRTAWRTPMEHSATLQGYVPPLIFLPELWSTQMEGKLELLLSSSRQATCKLHLLGSAQTQSIQRSIQGHRVIRILQYQKSNKPNSAESYLTQHFMHYLFRRAEKSYPLLVIKEHPSAEWVWKAKREESTKG